MSQEGEAIDSAIALDEAASAFGSLALEYLRTTSFFMSPTGDAGVSGGLFIGVADEECPFQKRCMTNGRTGITGMRTVSYRSAIIRNYASFE